MTKRSLQSLAGNEINEYRDNPVMRVVRARYPAFSIGLEQRILDLTERFNCARTDDFVVDALMAGYKIDLPYMWINKDARALTISELAAEFGNFEPIRIRREIWRRFLIDVAACHDEISALTECQLADLIFERTADEDLDFEDDSLFVDDSQLEKATVVDYERWLRMPALDQEEIAYLSMGYVPREESISDLKFLDAKLKAALKTRLDLIKRSEKNGRLVPPITSENFAAWLRLDTVSAPHELIETAALVAGLNSVHDVEKLIEIYTKTPEVVKINKSFYKLILGMAIARFEHSTHFKKGQSKRISGELEDINIYLSEDTIRTLLSKAATELKIEQPPPPEEAFTGRFKVPAYKEKRKSKPNSD